MRYRYRFLVLSALVIVCLFLFQAFYRRAKQDAIEELNARQMIYAKQAVKGIEGYIDHWITLLTATAM